MYAESIVKGRLDIAEEELGYRPEYHTTSEVDTFIRKLELAMKLDAQGKLYLPRELSHGEFRFIENERILCQCDAIYWLTRYAWVSDETNTAVRFKFRGAQRILMDVIADLEEALSAIELLIAKGRQQYVTTLVQLLDAHRVNFYAYVNCFTASADRDKSAEMARKAFFAYDHMPWWLRPKYSRRVEGIPGLLEFDTLDSRMTIVHGSGSARSKGAQRTGIARGTTPTVYHLSEVSAFPDPEEQIEAAIFRSVHASPKVLGILESTFAGDKGWFPEKYKYGKDNPLARHKSLFFPWPCARELYPPPTWWSTFGKHMPPGWKPQDKILEQTLKAELFVRSSELLTRRMGEDWTMPIEQQWFYHVQFTEAERSGTLSTFLQEMPCDDVEAMQSSFDNVFGHEVIEIIDKERERKYDVYGFCGQAIDERFEPDVDDIDYDRPRIAFNHTTPKGETYRWELVPLLYERFANATGDDSERPAINNLLFVYKHPEPGRAYSIGADSSNGIGRDASIVSVNLVGLPGTPDTQVAEFRSHNVGHVELFAFAMPIALFYKQRSIELASWPKFAIEQLASVGDVCQSELRKLGYPVSRMHRFGRYDGTEMKQVTNKVGWFTTGWSRPMLIGKFVHAVKNGWFILNSSWTIEECRQFEIHYTEAGKEKLEHANQSWDDGIFASAISYFIVHDMDSLAERSRRQFRGIEQSAQLPPLDLTPNRGNWVNPNSPLNKQVSIDDILRDRVGWERFRH
jgi:hypothetical protein